MSRSKHQSFNCVKVYLPEEWIPGLLQRSECSTVLQVSNYCLVLYFA